jgi:small conductance mechanosensitive channel
MSASEHLYAGAQGALDWFTAMTPQALAFNGGLSVAVVIIGLGATWLWRRFARWTARQLPGTDSADREVRTTRVMRLANGVVRLFVSLLVIFIVAQIWGVDLFGWATAGFGEKLVGSAMRLGLLVVAAMVAFEIAGFVISGGISKAADASHDPRRRAQLNTLGPLLRGIAQTTIVLVFTLMALGEVGVKIGPLLAGAGVVGLALGFGAQTIVKDFLTGLFLIIEDIVSVGDIIRIGESGGLVEQMTLRTIRLRDLDGTLHVFPYGEAQVVHNLTKTFSYYVFDLQVSYGSNIDRALEVMRTVGDGLKSDPAFADFILEPIEVLGVDRLGDSGVVLKARIKTAPIKQWVVGREYNRRIKLAFDREGVEIPFPHMQLVLPEKQISELAKH